MTIGRRNLPTKLTLLVSVAIIATPASAQEAENARSDTNPGSSNEIIVTANRRQQNLIDVSSAVSAISEEDLQRTGTDNFERLASTVPGLTMNQANRNRSVFNIRGIGTTVFGANSQDPVSVYINDAPVTDTYGALFQPDLRLFDVERVEVLRGPQGTLYGSGSLGGTIRILTNKPEPNNFAASGRVDLGVTEGGGLRQRYDLMANLPITEDRLGLRVVGYFRDEEGWVENLGTGTRNDTVDWGLRASLIWTPSVNTDFLATLIYQDSKPEDADGWNRANGQFKSRSTIATPLVGNFLNLNLTASHKFDGFADLTSSTTLHQTKTASLADLGDLFGTGQSVINNSDPWDSEFFTQEVRLTSNGSGPFRWVLGGFYMDRKTNVDFLIVAPGLDALFGGALGSDNYFASELITTSNERAIYADATYTLTPRFDVFGGIRLFETNMTYQEPNRVILGVSSSFSNEVKQTGTTWRAGMSFKPTESSQVYFSASKGFRVGQANPNRGPSLVDPNDVVIAEGYAPDSTLNWELGFKGAFADGRVRFNVALFRIDWSNIQLDFTRTSDRLNYTANAGKAVSQGVEFDLTARPVDGFELGLALTLQNSEIKEIDPASAIQTGVQVGDRLPGSVETKVSGFAQYSHSLPGGSEVFARVDGSYVGSSPNSFPIFPVLGVPSPYFAMNEAYENFDLQIGWRNDRWDVSLYAENLTNNDSFILDANGLATNDVTTLRPRTIGIRASFRY